MKNKSQALFYTVLLLGICFTILTLMYVYKPKMAEAEELKASNQVLQKRVDDLKVFYDAMDENLAEIQRCTDDILAKLKNFPADVREEDMIYLALRAANVKDEKGNNVEPEELLPVIYNGINATEKEEMAVIGVDIVKAAGIEELQVKDSEGSVLDLPIIFNSRTAVFNHITNYDTMKEMIKTINNSEEELAITRLAYIVNEENGTLDGMIQVTFYSVDGTNKVYKERNFSDFVTGLPQLFKLDADATIDAEAANTVPEVEVPDSQE